MNDTIKAVIANAASLIVHTMDGQTHVGGFDSYDDTWLIISDLQSKVLTGIQIACIVSITPQA